MECVRGWSPQEKGSAFPPPTTSLVFFECAWVRGVGCPGEPGAATDTLFGIEEDNSDVWGGISFSLFICPSIIIVLISTSLIGFLPQGPAANSSGSLCCWWDVMDSVGERDGMVLLQAEQHWLFHCCVQCGLCQVVKGVGWRRQRGRQGTQPEPIQAAGVLYPTVGLFPLPPVILGYV